MYILSHLKNIRFYISISHLLFLVYILVISSYVLAILGSPSVVGHS